MPSPPDSGNAPAPPFSERPDHFEFDLLDVDLDFDRDGSGKVVAVRSRTGDGVNLAKRQVDAP